MLKKPLSYRILKILKLHFSETSEEERDFHCEGRVQLGALVRETGIHSLSHCSGTSEEIPRGRGEEVTERLPMLHCSTALENIPLKHVFPTFSPKP